MARIEGNVITLGAGETFQLNVPLAYIQAGSDFSISIDGIALQLAQGTTMEFPSIYGYPGKTIKNNGSSATTIIVRRFGDVLNPEYFTDWRT